MEKPMPELILTTILSSRTKQGMVEITLNKEKMQMDIAKAKHVRDMLNEAIEAAITDTMIYQFFTEKIGFDDEKASMVLMDFREIRQGSRETINPN
jgi:hypothetical protein